MSSSEKDSPFELLPKRRIPILTRVLFLVIFCYSLISFSEISLIISSSEDIMTDLKITYQRFALIGAAGAIGRAVGTVLLVPLLKKVDYKIFFTFLLTTKFFFFILYYYITNFNFIFITRIIIGFFQQFEIIFFPGWCETNMPKNNTRLFLIQLSKPLGLVGGYYYSVKNKTSQSWETNFFWYGIALLILDVICILLPEFQFKCTKTIYLKKKKKEDKENEFIVKEEVYSDDDYNYMEEPSIAMNSKASPLSQFFKMIKQPQFIFSILSHASFLGILSTIQFYLNDYMTKVLKIFDHSNILYVFVTICLTSPILGLLGSSVLTNILFKDDKHKIIIVISVGFMIGAVLFTLAPLTDSMDTFFGLIWGAVTFGSFSVPTLMGVTINCTYQTFKLEAFIFGSLVNNLLGNFLSIFLYGYLNDTQPKNGKFPIFCTALQSWICFIFMGITFYYNWRAPTFVRKKKEDKNRSEGTNYLRLTRTSDVNSDVNKIGGDIVPEGRTTICDDESTDEMNVNQSYDETHEFSLNSFLQSSKSQQ